MNLRRGSSCGEFIRERHPSGAEEESVAAEERIVTLASSSLEGEKIPDDKPGEEDEEDERQREPETPEPWDPDDPREGPPRFPTDVPEHLPEEPEEPTEQD
jgi:hypothetical protein